MNIKNAEDFWSMVDKKGDCWLWMGGCNEDGYGTLTWNGKKSGAHRVALYLSKGEIPDNLNALHTCDNPPCCKPDHLFSGTQKENIQDAINKGRFHFVDKDTIRGQGNGKAKLTDSQVVEIRNRFSAGDVTQDMLANEYGVARSTISNLVREKGFHWKWLK